MKTTLDIADLLLAEAKKVAARDGVTLRLLVEEGLRSVLAHRGRSPAFVLRDARFTGRGRGLHAAFRHRGWAALREAAYGDDDA